MTLVALLSALVLMVFLFVQTSMPRSVASSRQPAVSGQAQLPAVVRSTTALTYQIYLPIIVAPPPAISGYITQNGVLSVGAQVDLERVSSGFKYPNIISRTITDASGRFQFYNVPSTVALYDERYRAVIHGDLLWYTPLITYTNGTDYAYARLTRVVL